jgi:putative peptidoglycan lipid II flippase
MDDLSDNARVTRAAGVVGTATLASRLLGYLRDMVIASFFGAGFASDAFIAAFRIPNLLRRLLGEGSLSIAFIPVFSDVLIHQGRTEAFRLAASCFRLLAAALILITLMGVWFTPALVYGVAYGFTDDPQKFELCVHLTRIMIPYVLFIGLVALCMGILNVLGHFAAPALAPTLLNLSMIGAVLLFSWLSPSQVTRVTGLAVGVLAGGILQLGLQLPFLLKKGVRFRAWGPWWHPAMKAILLLMGPSLFGAAVYQINSLILCLLGSFLPQGSISYLYFADRLVQFPLGIFAIAMATAVMPTLAQQSSTGQSEQFRETFSHALRMVFFIMLPCMAGLIVLRQPIVALLFQRGAFDSEATHLTASALLYYGIGLWAFAAVRIVLYAFYALKDTWTPVKIAVVSIVANTILGLSFMGAMQHDGLALALSLSSMLNLGLLTAALRKKMGAIGWRSIAWSVSRSALCAGLMAVSVWTVDSALGAVHPATALELMLRLLICIFAGVAVYGILAWVLRLPEIKAIKPLVTMGTKQR